MMEIIVRRGQVEDWPALVDFNCQMAMETENLALDEQTVTSGVQTLLEDSSMGFYVLAEKGNNSGSEIVGSLMITTEWSDWRNGLFWWIQSVYIRPEFRRQGIYRRLYDYVKELAAQEENVCGFRLYVEKKNRFAQQTYVALGMEETYYLMYEEVC